MSVNKELANITKEISKLSVKDNSKEIKDMASFQIKSADYDHIPVFDGKPHNLLKFITVVKQVKAIVCADNNSFKEINEKRLLSKVLARLVGEADYINTTCEFSAIDELIFYLEKTFRDSRSIEQLTFELFNTNIRPREHPLDFLHRLDKNRTLIISRHRIDRTVNRETVINHLEANLLYHFYTNMPLHIRTYLMTKTSQLKNLDDLRNLIQNENHLLFDDLISSGCMNKAGERVNSEHDNSHKKKQGNKFSKPQYKKQYYKPRYEQPRYYEPHQQYYEPRYEQPQAKPREITYPQENQYVPTHNKEWHPKDQHAYFNNSGRYKQNYSRRYNNQQRPYNGRTNQTVSMPTEQSRRNQQPMYEIEYETQEENKKEEKEDPRDAKIRELEEKLNKVHFLETGHNQNHPK